MKGASKRGYVKKVENVMWRPGWNILPIKTLDPTDFKVSAVNRILQLSCFSPVAAKMTKLAQWVTKLRHKPEEPGCLTFVPNSPIQPGLFVRNKKDLWAF